MDPELESPQIPLQPKLLSRSEILLRRTLLLTAVLILTAISGFLAYQNLQLQKQIVEFLKLTPIPTPNCTPLPDCAYNMTGSGPVCKIGEKPSNGGSWCPRPTPAAANYKCPSNGYVDCMPNPNAGVRFECTPEAFTWYKANCPNFQGGAL